MKKTPKDVLQGIKDLILPSQDKVEVSVALEEVATDKFTTEEEALARAVELGSEGSHTIEEDGVTLYMPTESEEAYKKLTEQPEEVVEEEVVEAAEDDSEAKEEEVQEEVQEEVKEDDHAAQMADLESRLAKLEEMLAPVEDVVEEGVELSEEVIETPAVEAPIVELQEVKEEKIEEFNHSPEKVTLHKSTVSNKRNTRVNRIFGKINNIK